MCRALNRSSVIHRRRRALTLAELLVAMVITALLAGISAGLAKATYEGHRYSRGHADATQHARVALERIDYTVSHARASAAHPGVAVVNQTVGGNAYPDTLVVWSPTGLPVNESGPPQISECVFYCCDPADPRRLIELRAASDTRTIPLDDTINSAPYPAMIAALKVDPLSQIVELTNLVRTISVSGTLLGAVRFERTLRPTAAEWTSYQASALAFNALSWPQGLYGSTMGVRHCNVRIELQLMPGSEAANLDTQGLSAVPFVGSATLYDDLEATH